MLLVRGLIGCAMKPLKSRLNTLDMYLVEVEKLICLREANPKCRDVGTVHVWVKLHGVLITTFSKDGLSAIATKLGTPLMLDSYTTDMCIKSWGRFSYARAMIEFSIRVELKDNIVAAMPKIIGEGYYTSKICVEYEWKPPRCACCKIFGHVLKECPKNLGVSVTKNLKKTSQTPKGIPVDNDVELDTNEGSTHLASQEENYSESLFWNAESSSPNTTPIMEKINKMENLIIDGKAILVYNEGKPLSKVDEDSEDEVASVDNDVANFLARNDGYGT
nr:hypothetical protein [Tanacetum cinerariifolium]